MNNIYIFLLCTAMLSQNMAEKMHRDNTDYDASQLNELSNMTENVSNSVGLIWILETNMKEVDGIEYPYTDIYLVFDDALDEKVFIGEYLGTGFIIENLSKYGFSENAITACQIYYAGGGANLIIELIDNDIVVIYNPIQELGPDDDDFNFQETKLRVKVPNGITQVEVKSKMLLDSEESVISKIDELITVSKMVTFMESDFETEYEGFVINYDSNYKDIIKLFGLAYDYEDNNSGYISGNEEYRRWNLCYPSYKDPEIRIVVKSKRIYENNDILDGDGIITGIELAKLSTNRGLKVGDSVDKAILLYGHPLNRENSNIQYVSNGSRMTIWYDIEDLRITSIFFSYESRID